MSSVDRDLIEKLLDIVRSTELAILNRIASRLQEPSGTRTWAKAKLAELGTLRRELTTELQAMNAALAVEIPKVVAAAYEQAGIDLTGSAVAKVAGQPAGLTALSQDLLTTTIRIAPYVLRTSLDAYRQAAGAELGGLILGSSTRRETSQRILDRLLGQGITGFTDKSGRNWRLDSYVEMATRAGLGNAYVQGRVDTLAADGGDLVYVIPGPTACPSCDQWIGKVLSLSGNPPEDVEVDGTLAHARSSGHLFGPNCRCVLAKYLPGSSVLPTEHADPAAYLAEQKQRALERAVRDAKRQQAVSLDGVAGKARAAKVRQKQADLREYLAEHPELRRQNHREQLRFAPAPPVRPMAPDYGDLAAWEKRQAAITSVNFHGEELKPKEVRAVERLLARGEQLEWVANPGTNARGERISSNDFIWLNHNSEIFELKSPTAKYSSVKQHIKEAVTDARDNHSVVKENFMIDLGDQKLDGKLRDQLSKYNQRVTDGRIRSLWVMSEDGTKLEQIMLR